MGALLKARGVDVRRGRRFVLRHVDCLLRPGALVQLVGANGSGKTSLLRVFAGLAAPAAGTVTRRGGCAFVPEKATLVPAMRCGEWLGTMRALRGREPLDWNDAVTASGLDASVLGRAGGALSKGMLQRIAVLEALHSGASLLLLDEPFSGLDGAGRAWLAAALAARVADGAAIVLIDHSDAAGTALAVTATLTIEAGRCRWSALAPAAPASVAVSTEALIAVRAIHSDGRIHAATAAASESDALLGTLLAGGWHIEEVRPCGPSSGI